MYVPAVAGETDWLPEVDWEPDHDPEAVQDVALVVLHAKVEDAPRVIVAGVTETLTVGAGTETLTVTDLDTVPPLPLQASVKVLEPALAGVTTSEPLVTLLPLQSPEAVQLSALVEVQFSVELWPRFIVAGLAVRVSVGAGALTVRVALPLPVPPAPVHASW